MAKLNRILVPVDFSACSRAAIDYASFLAQITGASVDVLHVWEPALYPTPEAAVYAAGERHQRLVEFTITDAGRAMEETLAELEKSLTGRVRGRLESGRPLEAILAAIAEGYDLVVMGTHGRRGVSRLVTGSVAEKVVRMAACPVVTVHAGEIADPVSLTA